MAIEMSVSVNVAVQLRMISERSAEQPRGGDSVVALLLLLLLKLLKLLLNGHPLAGRISAIRLVLLLLELCGLYGEQGGDVTRAAGGTTRRGEQLPPPRR